jgi:hypothetical protein
LRKQTTGELRERAALTTQMRDDPKCAVVRFKAAYFLIAADLAAIYTTGECSTR